MSFQALEICRAARSLIAEFGKEAEVEVERRILWCTKRRFTTMAEVWVEVRKAIVRIRADEVKRTGSDVNGNVSELAP